VTGRRLFGSGAAGAQDGADNSGFENKARYS
jgi:hypothetical protein